MVQKLQELAELMPVISIRQHNQQGFLKSATVVIWVIMNTCFSDTITVMQVHGQPLKLPEILSGGLPGNGSWMKQEV